MQKPDPLIVGVGSVLLKGLTPSIDLLANHAISGNEINILTSNVGDCRHILETIANLPTHKNVSKINFYVLERNCESLVRQLFHLYALERFDLTLAQRAELILDTYGNLLITEHAYSQVAEYAKILRYWIQGKPSPFRINVDYSILKFKEIDMFVDLYRSWETDETIDAAKAFDERLREYYTERYDHRENLIDWDIHMKLKKLGASIIYEKEFQHWRTTGVAFQMREGGQIKPNHTLLTTLQGSYVYFYYYRFYYCFYFYYYY